MKKIEVFFFIFVSIFNDFDNVFYVLKIGIGGSNISNMNSIKYKSAS